MLRPQHNTKAKKKLKYQCKDCPGTPGSNNSDKFDQLLVVITTLQQQMNAMQSKLNSIENQQLNADNETRPHDKQQDMDSVLEELEERKKRKRNVIIYDIDESPSDDLNERIEHDNEKLNQIMGELNTNVQNVKIRRLGKRIPGKKRPMQVITQNDHEAINMLKKARSMKKTNFKNDLTPMQRDKMRDLGNQLKLKQENGETGWGIKYVKGQPKLWKTTVVDSN
uniref:Uncharacterized protein n=1 Tax=Cacopsylla melanoneura TaxID=428564 RepID=A0A8D8WYF4_9HEMI